MQQQGGSERVGHVQDYRPGVFGLLVDGPLQCLDTKEAHCLFQCYCCEAPGFGDHVQGGYEQAF